MDTNYSLICFNKTSSELTFCLANRFFGGETTLRPGEKDFWRNDRLPDIFAWSSRLDNQTVHNIHSQFVKCLRCCFFPTSIKSSSRAGEQVQCLASWHTLNSADFSTVVGMLPFARVSCLKTSFGVCLISSGFIPSLIQVSAFSLFLFFSVGAAFQFSPKSFHASIFQPYAEF